MNTKSALLECAESLTRSRGMDAFSFADLAKALNIRKASVHYHFPTKADLALAMTRQYTVAFLDNLPMEGTAADRLAHYLDLYRDALAEGRQMCLCVSLSGSRHSLSDAVLAEIRDFKMASCAWLHGVFAQGRRDGTVLDLGDDLGEAYQCLAVVEGAQLMAHAAADVTIYDKATARMRARLIRTGEPHAAE